MKSKRWLYAYGDQFQVARDDETSLAGWICSQPEWNVRDILSRAGDFAHCQTWTAPMTPEQRRHRERVIRFDRQYWRPKLDPAAQARAAQVDKPDRYYREWRRQAAKSEARQRSRELEEERRRFAARFGP